MSIHLDWPNHCNSTTKKSTIHCTKKIAQNRLSLPDCASLLSLAISHCCSESVWPGRTMNRLNRYERATAVIGEADVKTCR